jgi:hypothetical protein
MSTTGQETPTADGLASETNPKLLSADQGRTVGLVPPPSVEYTENLDATNAGEAHRYHHVLDLYDPDLVTLGRAGRLLHTP